MMTAPTGAADAAIADYLDDLRDVLTPLPRERRRELVRDLESHIGAARAELDDPFSEAQIRNLLDRLGTPEEIAEAEGVEEHPPAVATPGPSPAVWREPATIVLLVFGGFAALVGWLVGVVLLWASPRWVVRDKVIGTLCVPGGLVGAYFVLARTITSAPPAICSEADPSMGFTAPMCEQSGTATGTWVLLAVLVVLPLASAVWLALRLRHDAA